MRSCTFKIFLLFYIHLHQAVPAFRNLESGSPTTSHTFSIKNKWPNWNEHVIAMEEEEWDESNISEFTRLVEQHEQTWKLAAEDIQLKKPSMWAVISSRKS